MGMVLALYYRYIQPTSLGPVQMEGELGPIVGIIKEKVDFHHPLLLAKNLTPSTLPSTLKFSYSDL